MHILTPMYTLDMFVNKHTETIEYVKKGYFYNLDPDPEPGPWTRSLDLGPWPWTRTLKAWTLKNLDLKNLE